MEEELHHVVLGKELGDGRQFIRADLLAGLVDLVLALRLPELVGPAESIIGEEALGRKGCEQLAQFHLIIERDGEIQHRVIPPEDTGQRATGESASQIEAIARTEFRSEFLALLQRDGHRSVGLIGDEQMVLGEEAGEEQAVPVLVGGQFGQVVDVLGAGTFVAFIPESPTRARRRLRSRRCSTLM